MRLVRDTTNQPIDAPESIFLCNTSVMGYDIDGFPRRHKGVRVQSVRIHLAPPWSPVDRREVQSSALKIPDKLRVRP